MATADQAVDIDALLLCLTHGASALVRADDLAGLWDMPADEALDTAAALDLAGWVEVWDDAPDGHVRVILSSAGAERFGLELRPPPVESVGVWACRWVPVGSPTPRPRPARKRGHHDILETDLTAPDATAGFLATIADYRDPHPNIVGSAILWRGPAWAAATPCPSCAGHPHPTDLCLVCCRVGRAVRLATVDPKPEPERRKYAPDGALVGGVGKASGRDVPVPERKGKARPGRKPGRPRSVKNQTPTTRANSFDLAKLRGGLGG